METRLPSSLFIELTHDTFHSASYVRPFSSELVNSAVGFRSVYLYDEDTYKFIVEQNAVRALDRFPVYSDTLFVDFDDGDASIDRFKSILNSCKVAWEMYFSGSKGYHFHIPIEPMYGVHVPYSQKQFILGLGIETADTSIYKHTGLIRLKGTWHHVTNRQKELVESSQGDVLRIPDIENALSDVYMVESSSIELLAALNRAYEYTLDEPGVGSRHSSLLALAKHLTAAGATYDTVFDMCRLVHNTWEGQYDEAEAKLKEVADRAVNWQSNIS
jgi:hypothetical protein